MMASTEPPVKQRIGETADSHGKSKDGQAVATVGGDGKAAAATAQRAGANRSVYSGGGDDDGGGGEMLLRRREGEDVPFFL